jgi:hypothetical protein
MWPPEFAWAWAQVIRHLGEVPVWTLLHLLGWLPRLS